MDSTVSTYVTQLSNGEADLTQAAQFYEDILGVLNSAVPMLVTTNRETPGGTGVIVDPANVINTLMVIFGNQQLGELSLREADWLYPNWRGRTNNTTVLNIVRESLPQSAQQLVTIPTSGQATCIQTYIPSPSLPAWLQMPVALLILAMEYARESSHQNLQLAKACKDLGAMMINILIS